MITMCMEILLLLEVMPEIALNNLKETNMDLYSSLQDLNHIIHKFTLDPADIEKVESLYKKAFENMDSMHSRTYLHIGYHFVSDIKSGVVVGKFNCQKQERGNRVCKLGVHKYTNKRVLKFVT
jgi:hypothetical protein